MLTFLPFVLFVLTCSPASTVVIRLRSNGISICRYQTSHSNSSGHLHQSLPPGLQLKQTRVNS